MKVLTIVYKLNMGGIEKTLLSCLPHLKLMGVEITVLCIEGGSLQNEYEQQGIRIMYANKYKFNLLQYRLLYQILKSEKFDIVHSRLSFTSGLCAKVCHSFNIPCIVSVHNQKPSLWIKKPVLGVIRNLYIQYNKKLTIKYSALILAHSKANLDYYSGSLEKYKNKLQVIYNGVDFNKFKNSLSLSENKKVNIERIKNTFSKILIHIGRFVKQKNHSFLIDIFNELNPIENKYCIILLGEGSQKEFIQQKVKKLKLTNNVFFAGMETNIVPFLNISDIFIFPSIHEGFGNVLIEAQYMKLAIIASNIDPHYEAIYNEYHEFLFDPYDKNDAIVKLKKLINTDITDIKEKAFDFAKKFSIEKMSKDLVKIYNQLYNS